MGTRLKQRRKRWGKSFLCVCVRLWLLASRLTHRRPLLRRSVSPRMNPIAAMPSSSIRTRLWLLLESLGYVKEPIKLLFVCVRVGCLSPGSKLYSLCTCVHIHVFCVFRVTRSDWITNTPSASTFQPILINMHKFRKNMCHQQWWVHCVCGSIVCPFPVFIVSWCMCVCVLFLHDIRGCICVRAQAEFAGSTAKLLSWLLDQAGRDQYVLRHGTETEVNHTIMFMCAP